MAVIMSRGVTVRYEIVIVFFYDQDTITIIVMESHNNHVAMIGF